MGKKVLTPEHLLKAESYASKLVSGGGKISNDHVCDSVDECGSGPPKPDGFSEKGALETVAPT